MAFQDGPLLAYGACGLLIRSSGGAPASASVLFAGVILKEVADAGFQAVWGFSRCLVMANCLRICNFRRRSNERSPKRRPGLVGGLIDSYTADWLYALLSTHLPILWIRLYYLPSSTLTATCCCSINNRRKTIFDSYTVEGIEGIEGVYCIILRTLEGSYARQRETVDKICRRRIETLRRFLSSGSATADVCGRGPEMDVGVELDAGVVCGRRFSLFLSGLGA